VAKQGDAVLRFKFLFFHRITYQGGKMQRVVRSTFAILTLAGLAACGDKVTVVSADTTKPQEVTGVTVTPATVTLNPTQTASLVATVNATGNVTDRTVTWSSSNTAVVTVAAAGPSTQVTITAVAPGTAAIVAKSVANTNVSGAAAVTVSALPPVSVSIGTINQGANISGLVVGIPADLTNAQGQLDITLNVESGNQPLQSVTAILKCGTDSIVQTQTISAAAAELAAEEAAAPVTLSINSSQLNAAQTAPLLRNNAACTVRATARTTSGTQSASGTTNLTINNPDMILATATFPARANDAAATPWWGGTGPAVTVAVRPIFFSGRTPAAATVNWNGLGVSATVTGTTSPLTVSFPTASGTGSAQAVDSRTVGGSAFQINVTDNQGNVLTGGPFGNPQIVTLVAGSSTVTPPNQVPQSNGNPGTLAAINFDSRRPSPGVFPLPNNGPQGTAGVAGNVFVGTSFIFAGTAAAGYCGPNSTGYTPANLGTTVSVCTGNNAGNTDNGGVDVVTVEFQTATNNTGTFTANVTNTNALDVTDAGNGYVLRQITRDALGNADTSFANGTAWSAISTGSTPALTRFGVDKQAPTFTLLAGTATDKSIAQTSGGTGNWFFSITDDRAGPGVSRVAQIRNWNNNSTAVNGFDITAIENVSSTNLCGNFGLPAASGAVAKDACVTPATAAAGFDPCVIGRFNAAQSASGLNAAQVFDRAGAALGWCTPVPYAIPGNNTLATNILSADATSGGYFTTVIVAIDEAGNRTTPPFSGVVAVDPSDPQVTALDLPGSITGNGTASFSASANDTQNNNSIGDLLNTFATLTYPIAVLRFPNQPITGAAPFDNVLTRTATAATTINNFMKNLVQGGPATPPTGSTSTVGVTDVAIGTIDESGRSGTKSGNFAAAGVSIGAGANATWSANFNVGVDQSFTNTTIWNCPTATTCGASANAAPGGPTSTSISMIAKGVTGLFTNPFVLVSFWYQNPTTLQWVQFGSTTTGVISDDNVTRTWTFSFTWDPPASGADGFSLTPAAGATIALNVRAIGQNANGDGVMTATGVLTISNQ